MNNRISFDYTTQIKADHEAKLADLRASVNPLVINLTPQEKKRLAPYSDKTVNGTTLDQIMTSVIAARPDLVPAHISAAEILKDRNVRIGVTDLQLLLKQISDLLNDTRSLAGSELQRAYMAIYTNLKSAAKHGDADAESYARQLKAYFPGRPNKQPKP